VDAIPADLSACLGIRAFGLCHYNPASPTAIYFGIGQAVSALAFTLAVQQLLKPIYRLRLAVRGISLSYLYSCVFAGVAAVMVAALVPNFAILHGGPWGYAIVWEFVAAILFVAAYAAVVVAILLPVKVGSQTVEKFAPNAATLLSSATETDHIDFAVDLQRTLPHLIKIARPYDYLRETSAFFDFIYRRQIRRASRANGLLRIIADPFFCETLIRRAPWRAVAMIQDLSRKQLYCRGGEQFVRELAHQAILRDDGMMARETSYHGFGAAPLLSDSLFSDIFIVRHYDPFDSFFIEDAERITPSMLKRFNSAANRSFTAIISHQIFYESQAAHNIREFYQTVFMRAPYVQKAADPSYQLPLEMHYAVRDAIKLSDKLLATARPDQYDALFFNDAREYRFDVLGALVDIVYEALIAISNGFTDFDDPFWTLAIGVFQDVFNSVTHQPDGLNPFQQRLMLKLIEKLHDNMEGYYPAICRVLLACVGPYEGTQTPTNRSAINLFKDAMYHELLSFPDLAEGQPDKAMRYLPNNVSYDPSAIQLTHTYRGGSVTVTNLGSLEVPHVIATDPALRRRLTAEERRAANLE
jgi:hypothetical protein